MRINNNMSSHNALYSISPIDGRYQKKAAELSAYFSEAALIKYRLIIEGEYLIKLSEVKRVGMRSLKPKEVKLIRSMYICSPEASEQAAARIKNIESTTNHDVKSVEYYMKETLKETSLSDVLEWIHFSLTSEDTNNLAYALMLSESVKNVMVPSLDTVLKELNALAIKYRNLPMLARTHGQPASPTTFGKECKVFAARLSRQIIELKNYRMLAKLNGATGNYNAHAVVYPNVDWKKFTKQFIDYLSTSRKIKLEPNLTTTQIESHDTYAELFDIMSRINTILISFDQDMWRYISDEWIVSKPKDGEVGSSTMPHKVNPIDFEQSEGNLGIANALFGFFSSKLPIARLQRDLTDSTVERNFGVALAHSLVGYMGTLKGLSRIAVNEKKMKEVLNDHPEVVTEAIQTVLRTQGVAVPYEQLKEMSRGKKVTIEALHAFINSLDIKPDLKKRLKKIKPENYIGLAAAL